MSKMSPTLASEAYRVLVEHCAADPSKEATFVDHLMGQSRIGDIDFPGGRFNSARFMVEGYAGHLLPARRTELGIVNKKLAQLFSAAPHLESGTNARAFVKKTWPAATSAYTDELRAEVYDPASSTVLGTGSGEDSVEQAWIEASLRIIRQNQITK